MKKTLLISLILLIMHPCQAKHIIGGEMIYQYIGPGSSPNTSQYLITLKLFRDNNAPPDAAPMPGNVYIGIFNNDNSNQYPNAGGYYDVTKNSEQPVTVNPFPVCIHNPPALSYNVGLYSFTVDLPKNNTGYTASFQTCCRISPLTNVSTQGGNGTGSTYTCSIPGIHDNSPQFSTSIDAICGNKPFHLQFNATDADGDSLVYVFAQAYDGGKFQNSGNGNPAPPPYNSVPYMGGVTYQFPLGSQATIDPQTGIISGIAPDVGRYVVGVGVASYRNGVLINVHTKDFIVNVTDCDFAGAKLDPKPVSCDGFTVSFSNEDFSPLNKSFYWDFGDAASGTSDTSTMQSPTHVYSDTGTYVYKLVVNRGDQCSDSATQIVKVYPGFFPDFAIGGKCINSPIQFTDKSKTNYGLVNTWSWNFGDPLSDGDTSHLQNPTYTFSNTGSYPVQLSITSTKGCNKSITDTITIIEKPQFSVTNDTLICNIDTLQLTANGIGTVSWTPNYNINNQNSFTPLVSPKVPTTYFATLFESPGCIATDSVHVDVVSNVSLNAGNDTTICLTDTVRINTTSNGLHYLWTPANTLISDTAKNPLAIPQSNTAYHVVASIGKCSTSDDITLRIVPYPKANSGKDTSICFPDSYQLVASGGSIYLWSPAAFLNNTNIANPVTTPAESIRYVVKVNDVLGCPKSTYDTVVITVEKVIADAGPRDTIIVVNQPLQLNGTGAAESFTWSPPKGLSNPYIPNPVATLSDNQQYVLKLTSSAGCTDSDTIDVIVYKVKPGIFVPNSFTPNGDGLNDVFRPILIGMKQLNYFKVYNRGGQLIFSTNIQNKGWDGTFKGSAQDAAVYVWMVQGIDYQGKTIFEKGSVTLIR
ncbi:MAG: PKD domain-containing protein [Bacteroidota bacterium]|nr:PKD domain-containing protein [Bacteroidota bacterium]